MGELGKFMGGGTPSTKNVSFWNGTIPWISSSDLTDGDIFKLKITRYLTKEAIDQSATKIIPSKSILIVARVRVGKIAVNEIPVCTSQDFLNLIVNEEVCNYKFLALLLQAKTKYLLGFVQGTSIKGFVKDDLSNLSFTIPSIVEQTTIAKFLTSIDKKIALLDTKLQQAQTFKKGLLQQLFN